MQKIPANKTENCPKVSVQDVFCLRKYETEKAKILLDTKIKNYIRAKEQGCGFGILTFHTVFCLIGVSVHFCSFTPILKDFC